MEMNYIFLRVIALYIKYVYKIVKSTLALNTDNNVEIYLNLMIRNINNHDFLNFLFKKN